MLGDVEKAHDGCQIGSYPFFRDGRVGANFVVRTTDPAKLTPLSEIGALSHKIAGVAETLGFGDIGQLAGWIDGEITRRARAGEPPIAIWRKIDSPLEDMLEKMEDLLDA